MSTDLPARIGDPAYRLLGVGSASRVFEAQMVEPRPYAEVGARVAVKLAAAAEAAAVLDRIEREAELGATIAHPGVVRVFELGTTGSGAEFVVQELVAGRSLRVLLDASGPLAEEAVRRLGASVARGLQAVHDAGLVHRDVKPSNILTADQADAKLADLGVARRMTVGESDVGDGCFIGSPAYAAPEQFTDDADVTARSDLYALGVVLFEAATGKNPFAAPTFAQVMRRHLELDPPSAAAENPQLSRFLDALLGALLERAPEDRIGSAGELAAILEAGPASRWWTAPGGHPGGRATSALTSARRFELCGRHRELASLRATVERAAAGRGSGTLIVGEAGVGKTRLLAELATQTMEAGTALVLHGAWTPSDTHDAGDALARSIVDHFGEADVASRLRPLAGRLASLVPAFVARAGVAGEAAAVPLSAVRVLLARIVESLQERRPVLWVLEDLHLATNRERATIASLAGAVARLRVALVASTRPELGDEQRPAPEALVRLLLDRLSSTESVSLAERALAAHRLSPQLADGLAARSGGNPFYLLEMVSELETRGEDTGGGRLADAVLPGSVRQALDARLGRLGDDERAALEAMSVQGYEFDADLIGRSLGRAGAPWRACLAGLERARLIRDADGRARFDHHLIQEHLYGTLSAAARAELHRRLASACEATAASPPTGETAAFLATHYLHGGRLEDAARFEEQGLAWLRAVGRYDAVVAWAETALARLGEREPRRRALLWDRLGGLYNQLGDRARERQAAEQALAAARQAGDPKLVASSHILLAIWHQMFDHNQAALAEYRQARAAVAEHGDLDIEVSTAQGMGLILASRLRRFDEALRLMLPAVELAEKVGYRRGLFGLAHALGVAYLCHDRWTLAKQSFRRAVHLLREAGQPARESIDLVNLGIAHLKCCEHGEALECFAQCIDLSRRSGEQRSEATALCFLGSLYTKIGRLQAARAYLDESVALCDRIQYTYMRIANRLALIELELVEGRLAAAESWTTEARSLLGSGDSQGERCHLQRLAGQLGFARGDREALAQLQRALAVADELESNEHRLECHVAIGRLQVERGDSDGARLSFARCAAILRELEAAGHVPLVDAYRRFLGDGTATPVATDDDVPVAVAAEAHAVAFRTDRDATHLARARDLLDQLSSHLTGGDLAAFWDDNPVARMVRALRVEQQAG